ncbi:MAG: hypothetical protein JSS27_18215 [Planctomycetes bacterium]|nr:hypothetical protein [Planctomycetota bacterium]
MSWLNTLLGRAPGAGHASLVDFRLSLSAEWAQQFPWLAWGCVALLILVTVLFYRRYQAVRSRSVRFLLTTLRAAALALVLLLLAEPSLVMRVDRQPRPWLWLLFDGTQSMAIADDLATTQRQQLNNVLDLPASSTVPDRQEYVKSLLRRERDPWIARLSERFRLRAFIFDRNAGVRPLQNEASSDTALTGQQLAEQLTSNGEVTAIGNALADLAHRHTSQNLAGVVVVSDFDQNSGLPALTTVERLHAPIYTVGIGPEAAVDLSIELTAPLLLKKSEAASLTVTLKQTELEGRTVNVRLIGWPPGHSEGPNTSRVLGERQVELSGETMTINMPVTPEEVGRWVFAAEVDPQEGEVVRENNVARREAVVQDNFLRLMFVEHEPTWEWRFVKEVFHRDPLVGQRGFRTFLRSADPKVRQSNELFLPSLVPPRSEFFANDVIFLGDVPGQSLSTRFGERVKEFVDMFGGGLVVMAGPNFGPGQLAHTPLADLLPVVVDPDARLRDERPFAPRLTPEASHYDFMQLGATPQENREAWSALNPLPWYQPVLRVRDGATILLAHPTDRCVDGRTPQPLLVMRPYGKGQVVYLAFNEMWRLRRKYGEKYYRHFWAQMIYRLGLSHTLGSQKRFVVRTDRQSYQVDDSVLVTVDAFDEDYDPLTSDKLPDRKLVGHVSLPARGAAGSSTAAGSNASRDQQPLSLAQVRPGVYETRLTALVEGEHRIQIEDPLARQPVEVTFQVTPISVERRTARRNVSLQQQLAAQTGGRSYDLITADRLPEEIPAHGRSQSSIEVIPLGHNWIVFLFLVCTLIVEWLLRKLINLA